MRRSREDLECKVLRSKNKMRRRGRKQKGMGKEKRRVQLKQTNKAEGSARRPPTRAQVELSLGESPSGRAC
jgi:hypothetical protein